MNEKEITIKIKKLDENAVIPSYSHDGDVGMDMTAIGVEYDPKNDMYIYHTGLSFESDKNIGQFLFLRSSNRNTDSYLCNHVGIADSAIYRGEIMFCFKNRTSLNEMIQIEYLRQSVMLLSKKIEVNLEELYWKVYDDLHNKAKNMEFAPYKVGDRVGQTVFIYYPTVEYKIVEELSESERGKKGFGSTGN